MFVLLGKLVKAYGLEMLARSVNIFLFLFVLHYPPSLLIPLAQQDAVTTSDTNNLLVLTNQLEQITPNYSIVTELIQQIDVKDNAKQATSNINHVVVTDENIQNDNNGTQNNGSNDLVAHNLRVSIENTSSSLNDTGVTNTLADPSSLLLINSQNNTSGNALKAENIAINELQNNLGNETQVNLLNTNNNANVNNATVKEVGTVQNSSTSNVNVSSILVPYANIASGRTTSSISIENVTGLPSLQTIDGENTLHESLNEAEVDPAWRSDISVGKNKTRPLKNNTKLDSQNVTLQANNINGSASNNNSDLLNSKNDEEKSIFVILNSGNIYGLSVNSPANSGNLQANSNNNPIENLDSNNSKFLNNLINSSINYVLSKILPQIHSNTNPSNVFLLLNSGSISNVHVSSPVLENIVKNITLKDRMRRHLNESNTNNTNVESVTLKSSTDKSNHIIDGKFRTGEHQSTQKTVTKEYHVATIPLDNNQNNSTLGNAPDNSNTTVIEIPIEDISSAEAPAFRSMISDKVRKVQQVSNVVNNALNETKDHNLVLKLLPESPPISIDLNQIPLNDLLGGAMSFMKRLKRNTHDKAENSYPLKTNCKSKQIDEHHTVKSCKKSKSLNNYYNVKPLPTRKTFDGNISNVLKLYDSVEIVCPLSVIVKLYSHQVLSNLSKKDPDSVLNKIVNSLVNGNEGAINLGYKELSDLPIPVKLRFQLVHGKTKEFMEQLSDIVDATLCSLS